MRILFMPLCFRRKGVVAEKDFPGRRGCVIERQIALHLYERFFYSNRYWRAGNRIEKNSRIKNARAKSAATLLTRGRLLAEQISNG
jgi:hypothetical protein